MTTFALRGMGTHLRTSLTALVAFAVLLTTACAPGGTLATSEDLPVEYLSPEVRLRKKIDSHAASYVGSKYVYGAKGPNSFDCSGFTSYVLREFDIILLGSSMSQAKQGRAISPQAAQPGDIVYFQNPNGRVNHVAIVVYNSQAGLEVVHATTSRGVVRENISESSYWAPRLAGARCVSDCRRGIAAAY